MVSEIQVKVTIFTILAIYKGRDDQFYQTFKEALIAALTNSRSRKGRNATKTILWNQC